MAIGKGVRRGPTIGRLVRRGSIIGKADVGRVNDDYLVRVTTTTTTSTTTTTV